MLRDVAEIGDAEAGRKGVEGVDVYDLADVSACCGIGIKVRWRWSDLCYLAASDDADAEGWISGGHDR